MKVLVTGATGFVGSAVVAELQRRGHGVTGVARSVETAASLVQAGAAVHRGDVTDPDSIVAVLSQVDGVVHTAFNHDFSKYFENAEADAALLDALARNLVGTTKPIVATSATTVAPPGSPALESVDADPANPRSASERFLRYAEQGVRASLVRLPASVHGEGDKAFVPALINIARETGVSAYVDDGINRWGAVHRFDAARLFCDAVEQARSGIRYHGVTENIAFKGIAEAIAKGLGVPAKSIGAEEAEGQFGWLTMFAAADIPANSDHTRELLGWSPKEIDLLTELSGVDYFT